LSKLKWSVNGKTYVTGFIFNGNRFIRNEELLEYFSSARNLEEFRETVKMANGQFSVIIRNETETWLAVDRTRNRPLFYTTVNGQIHISDDCYKLARMKSFNEFDPVSYNSFLASGYTIGNRTLIKDIFQAEAGTIIVFGKSISSFSYHMPASEKTIFHDLENGSLEFSKLIDQVFRNYFSALQDKFIAIPLSGGFDSRLVALMASKYHPENVLCYTYGREDNPEVALAMESARRLKINWINIVYNNELVDDFIHDDFFETYFPWVSELNGMFFLQEYFAVRYLKQNKLVPGNTVFISGYSGDFIAGSYLTPVMQKKMNKKNLSELIFREYFRMVGLDSQKRNIVTDRISEAIPADIPEPWKLLEEWDMKERHAKFIVNSAKVFTFFGYEYVFPLWDNDLVDFMLPLPFELRMDRRLFEHTLRDIIFRDNNMNLESETNPTPLQKSIQRFKEKVKPLLPVKIRNLFIDPYNAIFYDEITRVLKNDTDKRLRIPPGQPNYYNSYIIQWYLAKTAGTLKITMTQ